MTEMAAEAGVVAKAAVAKAAGVGVTVAETLLEAQGYSCEGGPMRRRLPLTLALETRPSPLR